MRNYLLILYLISSIAFSGCSTKNIDFQRYKTSSLKGFKKLENISLPFFNNLTLDPSVPSPTNLTASSSMTEVSLHWNYKINSSTSGYRVFRYSDYSRKYVLIQTIPDIYATSYVDKDLKPYKVYRYKVSAYTKDKRVSPASSAVTIRTRYILSQIKTLRASRNLVKQIKLAWNLYPQHSLIKYYQVQRSKDKTKWEDLHTIYKALQTQYIDRAVKSGDAYYYRLKAVTFDGVPSPYSNIAYGDTKTLPKMITEVLVRSNLPRQIQLSWIDPNLSDKTRTILKYNIYTSLYKDKVFIKHATTSNKYYIDKIQKDGEVVNYKITAVDNFGLESPLPTAFVTATTKANSPSPQIIEYKLADGRVIIRWLPMRRNIKEYMVKKSFSSKFFLPKTIKYTGIKGTQFVDNDITLNKTYKYQVIGIDNDGVLSKPSKSVSIEVK